MTTQPNPYLGDPIKSIKIRDITFHDPSTNLTNNKKRNTNIQRELADHGILYVGHLDNYEISEDKRQIIPLSGVQNAHVSIPGISTILIETMQIVLKTIGYQFGNDQQQVIVKKQPKSPLVKPTILTKINDIDILSPRTKKWLKDDNFFTL